MTTHRLLNRRMAIAEMGKAGLGIVVFGAAACSDPAATVTTVAAPGTVPTTTALPRQPRTNLRLLISRGRGDGAFSLPEYTSRLTWI